MRALQVENHASPPVFVEVPHPKICPTEILISVTACSLNFADLLMINGTYQETPNLPFTLGMEIAGTVVALGETVKGFKIGDRVAAFAGSGGLAEYAAADESRCLKIADALGFEQAACSLIAYGTSHLALTHRANLKPDDTLLVLGASGGVGLTAVEIGKALGAQVVAVARGRDKLDVCRTRGADILIDSSAEDIHAIVKGIGGVDVVYDPIGGKNFVTAMRCCRPEARYLVIGFASGEVPQIKANHLLVKNVDVKGFYWGGYLNFAPHLVTESLSQIFKFIEQGTLSPHISKKFAFSDAINALAYLKERKSTGKIVIEGFKGDL